MWEVKFVTDTAQEPQQPAGGAGTRQASPGEVAGTRHPDDAEEEGSQTGAASHVQRWDRQFVPLEIQHLSVCAWACAHERHASANHPLQCVLHKHAPMYPPCV